MSRFRTKVGGGGRVPGSGGGWLEAPERGLTMYSAGPAGSDQSCFN